MWSCPWYSPAGHSMTAGGMSCEGCRKFEAQGAMARWVLSTLSDGARPMVWSTWTVRDPANRNTDPSRAYTRVGVAAIRAKADRLATALTSGAEEGSAFVAVEGWTTGQGKHAADQPRHHLHSLATVSLNRLKLVGEGWEVTTGFVLHRQIQGGDLQGLALYAVKDCVKANGYFAVGGKAWRRSTSS